MSVGVVRACDVVRGRFGSRFSPGFLCPPPSPAPSAGLISSATFCAGGVDCITTMMASALDRFVQLNFLRHSSRSSKATGFSYSPGQGQGDLLL